MSDVQTLTEARDAARERMNRLNAQAKSLSGRAKVRTLSEEEVQKVDDLYDQFEAAEVDLQNAEQELREAKEFDAHRDPANSRGRVVPPGAMDLQRGAGIHIPKSARFADMFPGNKSDVYAGKFSGLGEFCLAVASGKTDPRLIVNASMTEGSGVSAGFLVPPQFIAEILDGALEQEVIRPNATVLPMASSDLDTAAFDFQDGTSGKRAGLQLLWGGESAALTEQVGKTRKVSFTAKKATILCRVSSELTEDAPAFDRQLSTAMTQAVAAGLDGAFVSGTGAGQPMGILNAPCLITVAKESGQATLTLLLQNLANMLARLTPSAYKRSTWLVHPTVLPSLLQLTVVVKNIAGTEYVGGGLAAAVVQGADGVLRIFGRPVEVTDACSTFTSAGDVILGDLSQYAIGMRSDVRIEIAHEAYFSTDELAWKLRMRLDGLPLASTPTKLRDGTNTVSPFVALGAR
jgi:HK97 family phage major capsid protein